MGWLNQNIRNENIICTWHLGKPKESYLQIQKCVQITGNEWWGGSISTNREGKCSCRWSLSSNNHWGKLIQRKAALLGQLTINILSLKLSSFHTECIYITYLPALFLKSMSISGIVYVSVDRMYIPGTASITECSLNICKSVQIISDV